MSKSRTYTRIHRIIYIIYVYNNINVKSITYTYVWWMMATEAYTSTCDTHTHIYIYIDKIQTKKYIFIDIHRRKLRSQTSDNRDRWKSRGGQSQRGEEKKREDQRRERVRWNKDACARKGRKVAKHCVFSTNFFCFAGSKSRLAKAGEIKNCTPRWREADLEVKMLKTPRSRTIFGNWDVQKVHAVVAQSGKAHF